VEKATAYPPNTAMDRTTGDGLPSIGE
jgi:hypothetical protein